MRLRNKQADLRQWRTRNDMTINVGIGNGGKAEQFVQMMAIANIQKEMLAGGKAHLVSDQALQHGRADCGLSGHRMRRRFLTIQARRIRTVFPPKHPASTSRRPIRRWSRCRPDIQMKQQELQMKQQEIVAGAEIEKQSDQRKAEIETVQARADIETNNRKIEAEMAQAQQKFELERELKILDFQLKREMQMAELEMRREQHQQALQAAPTKAVPRPQKPMSTRWSRCGRANRGDSD